MYKEMKKIQTANWSNKSVSIKRLSESVNIATVKRLLLKSETNMEIDEFPDFADLLFFWHKKVRVGGKILGSVGRSEAHIFFCLALPRCR